MNNTGAAAPPLPVLMTVDEAAEYLHVTPWTIRWRITHGAIPYTRMGNRVYILRDELAAEIHRNSRVSRQKEATP